MTLREATLPDIPDLQYVRQAVRENVLSNPDLVTHQDYITYLTQRGKGWVCEIQGQVVGFAIADLRDKNIWALFVHPDFEKRGIGRQLHTAMLAWYFSQTQHPVWLSTEAGSRAETFYRKSGWVEKGQTEKGERLFEMTAQDWQETFREAGKWGLLP